MLKGFKERKIREARYLLVAKSGNLAQASFSTQLDREAPVAHTVLGRALSRAFAEIQKGKLPCLVSVCVLFMGGGGGRMAAGKVGLDSFHNQQFHDSAVAPGLAWNGPQGLWLIQK